VWVNLLYVCNWCGVVLCTVDYCVWNYFGNRRLLCVDTNVVHCVCTVCGASVVLACVVTIMAYRLLVVVLLLLRLLAA
jgi:hypothetical protein